MIDIFSSTSLIIFSVSLYDDDFMMMPLLWYYDEVNRKIVLMRKTFLAYLIGQLEMPVCWMDSTSWKCLHISKNQNINAMLDQNGLVSSMLK